MRPGTYKILSVRPAVLAGGGLLFIMAGLLAQACASYQGWSRRKIMDWRPSLAVDFSQPGTCQMSFKAIASYPATGTLTLRVPLEGELAQYRGRDASIPPDTACRALAAKPFCLSWQIVHADHVLAEGAVTPADLRAWPQRDCMWYQHGWDIPRLERGKQYTLLARVEQANQALNSLGSTLQLRTWGSKSPRYFAAYAWSDTAWLLLVGILLLWAAYVVSALRRPSQ